MKPESVTKLKLLRPVYDGNIDDVVYIDINQAIVNPPRKSSAAVDSAGRCRG